MPDMTPLERLVHDELARAGKGQEALAVTRCWRAVVLRSLSSVLAGREQNHLGVLGVSIHAAELYGYTLLNVSLANDGLMVCFARQGIADVTEYLDWCRVFFSHLSVIAEELPEPLAATVSVETIAKANAAVLQKLCHELSDEAVKVEDGEARSRAAGNPDAMGTISISVQTFRGLGRALESVICAWLTPEEKQQFAAEVGRGSAELVELHDLVRIHVNERSEGVNDDEPTGDAQRQAVASEK